MKFKLQDLTVDKTTFIVSIICFFLCIASFFFMGYNKKELKKSTEKLVTTVEIVIMKGRERSYAQGQLDATKNIIRIRMINDSTCVWVNSPWGKIKPLQDTIILRK
jgi:hypothetical protein